MAYRRRSAAATIIKEVSLTANRLPWKIVALLGVVLFVTLYWIVPGWLQSYIASSHGRVSPAIEFLVARRIHWLEWIGTAAALVCGFFAARNYFASRRLKGNDARNVGFVSRLLAKWLD